MFTFNSCCNHHDHSKGGWSIPLPPMKGPISAVPKGALAYGTDIELKL